jgi:hypothetical protein
MIENRFIATVMVAGTLMLPGVVVAEDLFSISLTVDGTSDSASYDTVEDIVAAVDNNGFSRIVSSYTDTSVATANLSIRGIPAIVQYKDSGTTLTFSAPAAGVSEVTFTGATRDESQDLFETYLENNSDDLLEKLFSYAVANTAVDPVAGNPNSLVSTMASSDFSQGTELGGGSAEKTTQASSASNSFELGARFGQFAAGDFTQNAYTLPIAYTFRFDSDPRYQLKFDAPITYIDTDGAQSFHGSLGVGLRIPVTDDWSVTPAVRAGAVGSIDMAAAAVVYGGSVTSNYNLYYDDLKFSIGNSVGMLKTTSVSVEDYEIAYELLNQMTRNGVGVEGPLDYTLFGKPTSWQASAAYTQFFGDELYVDGYADFAVSFGTRASDTAWDNLRIGVVYTVGNNDYQGARLNFGYTF